MKGSAGRQTVTSGVRVRARQWYRARCTRDGTTVRLAVRVLRRDGSPAAPSVAERSGATGDLAFATSPEAAEPSLFFRATAGG